MDNIDIKSVILPEEKVELAGKLVASSMFDNPIWAYIAGLQTDHRKKREFMEFMFTCNFKLRFGTNCNCVVLNTQNKIEPCENSINGNEDTSSSPELLCFFNWTTPGISHPTIWQMVRLGFVTGICWYGIGTFKRVIKSRDWYVAKEVEILNELGLHPDKDVIRLERMVVCPEMQGQGIGTKVLTEKLKIPVEVTEEVKQFGTLTKRKIKRYFPVILWTQETRNVTFYNRLGWEMVYSDIVFPSGEVNKH